jgi:hypothetical protein
MLTDALTDADRDRLLDEAAAMVARRRLEVPAALFLEMYRPLTFVASQALIVFTPLLGPLFGPERLMQLAQLLEDRGNVDRLLERLETASREGRDGGTEAAVGEEAKA